MEKRLNYAPCGFLSINHEGIITDLYQTFLQWMGYKQADLINKHIEILMSTPNN